MDFKYNNNFKSLSTQSFRVNEVTSTSPESKYWQLFDFPVTSKELGPITYIDFAPGQDRRFAASTSAKIQLYSTLLRQVESTISRFHDSAYGGSFRADGKLLVAGTEQGRIQLFDVANKSQLRIFNGHTAATHLCKFCNNNTQVVSFSDDKSSILWDISTEGVVVKFDEHEDYVRTGAVSKSCNNTFISGSYDHKVKMFDMRTPKSVMTVNHNVPVESVIFFPTGNVFISAGGTEIKVWDVLTGGKLIANISQHHKTITCMSLANDNKHLLSGSLDKNVKVYSTDTYQASHTINFPSAILSLGVSPCDDVLAVGMVDGLLSMQKKRVRQVNAEKQLNIRRKKIEKQLNSQPHEQVFEEPMPTDNELYRRHKLDRLLKEFDSSGVLNYAIKYFINKPEVVMTVIQELIRRDQLLAAVGGRDNEQLCDLYRFINRYISNPNYTRILIDFSEIILDIYTDISGPNILKKLFLDLRRVVDRQIVYINQGLTLSGKIDLLLTAADSDVTTTTRTTKLDDTPVQTLVSQNSKKMIIE